MIYHFNIAGKYIEVEPLGIHHCVFTESGNHYTWRKVKTVVHNIVIGKLWVDQHGEMSVINHSTNDKCHMKFDPYSYFGGTPKKVTGTIVSNKEKVRLTHFGELQVNKRVSLTRWTALYSLERLQ